tara:strand:- start:2150 stop:2740 length:591 start_codon:yes stop_codon:yes gene_type:complete
MGWNQLVTPNYNTQDYAGWCLRHTRVALGAPSYAPTAWDAWLREPAKRETRDMPSADVPVFFSFWGTYNGISKNWGHTGIYQASTGRVFSSPGSGYGNKWFASIEQACSSWGLTYVGWSESLAGKQIVSFSGDAPTAPAAPIGSARQVKILPGMTLWGLASQYYGDGSKYMTIFNASNFSSGNPSLIFPGEIATIP